MTHEEIEACRQELQDTLAKYQDGVLDKGRTEMALRALAHRVGASTHAVFLSIVQARKRHMENAEIPELAYNIHFALQTASMIDACRTAAKNSEIALKAQENARVSQWVAIIAMFATVAIAVAAWVWH